MNNSKEALRELCSRCYVESDKCTCHSRYKGGKCKKSCEHRDVILKDLDRLENLEKENKELKKARKFLITFTNDSIKSMMEERDEALMCYTKLKNALKFLQEELDIKLCSGVCLQDQEYYLDYRGGATIRTLHKIAKEQYELLTEVLKNEK